MTDFEKLIAENNKTHVVDEEELKVLVSEAKKVFKEHHTNDVWFERSIFINWTCAIADCKYCYLSTTPKKDMKALRSKESICAEALICVAMGWEIGYITGGLRVEDNEYLIDLMDKINKITKEKIKMNFGPYPERDIIAFKPHISGMGSAIESFDEELHKFICPSKPLASLMKTLENLQKHDMQKFITIILGMGEKKDDVEIVIEKIKEYNIEMLQLCFLKPQARTVFTKVPPPDMDYMQWWVAKVRIACPDIIIKIALVPERIEDFSKLLEAGVNNFSRFIIFDEFNSELAHQLEAECTKAERKLVGHFTSIPAFDVDELVNSADWDTEFKEKVRIKAKQYYQKLVDKLKTTN